MIGKHIGPYLLEGDDPLMIESERCATVRTENTLMHAMLLLSSVGFSSVPVLNADARLAGTVSMPQIINGVLDDENYNWEHLDVKKVKDVMATDVPTVFDDSPLEDILHLLVDANYLCVTDHDGGFRGIIARKQILKRVNRLAHDFEIDYLVKARPERSIEMQKDMPSTHASTPH